MRFTALPALREARASFWRGGGSAGHDLGVKTYLNGALLSTIVLDTSTTTTDTVDDATDGTGPTSTSTVIVEPLPSTSDSQVTSNTQ